MVKWDLEDYHSLHYSSVYAEGLYAKLFQMPLISLRRQRTSNKILTSNALKVLRVTEIRWLTQ